jgi:sugar/nucleoside kinase (ribokinase family)
MPSVNPSTIPSAHAGMPALPADVVVFGEALVDMFPEKPGLPLEEVEHFVRHLGGAPCNLAVNLGRQGVRAVLYTLVGSDPFGRFIQQQLASEGVVVDSIGVHKSARTGVTFVAVSASGGRSFLFYRHPSADMLISPADLDPVRVSRGRVFHFGSSTLSREPARSATQKALELATRHRASKLVSCDVNLRPRLWPEFREAPPLLRQAFARCDVVKLTREELLPVCGTENLEAAAALVRKLGPAVVVITLGESGSYLDCVAGQAFFAAEKVDVVDKTGAGDAYTAGLLSGILSQLGGPGPDDLRERLRALTMDQLKRACLRGNYLGGRACTALGATTAVPRAQPV